MNYFPLVNYSYIVKKDDTLENLASRFNLRVETLKKVNPIIKDKILAGQIINIPLKDEMVNKINQISYSLSIDKHEYILKIQSLLLNLNFYRYLLTKDKEKQKFNHLYYKKYMNIKDDLCNLLPIFLIVEFNIKYKLQKLLELWLYDKSDINEQRCISELTRCFIYYGEDFVNKLNALLIEITKLFKFQISQDGEVYELIINDQIIKKLNKLASLIGALID
ncbi:TPA: LysM peptidoglycan-binding domain-containing protein [bacterium]|nr:LysM peptidoglycan-binding domain-containing protein [bacterium]